jgi:RND family efflux transporter MFP subunit
VIRKYLLPLLAIIGLIFAIWMVKQASKPVLPARPVADPPRVSFENKISGVGIVEASTRNIAIGSHVSGIVQRVQVRVAQKIKAGDPLFTLDGRAKKADLAIREARVLEESANLKDLEAQMKVAEKVKDPRAISADDLNKRRFAVQVAEARLANAVAQVEAARIEIDLLTVRSPIDGEVLQVNIRPGEYAPTGTTEVPLILIGNLDRLHVRVDVDENDAWRFQPGAPAVAYVRGNPEMKTDLRFEYIEKYVVPKRSLTGESTERVDTRVMQVVYSFDRRNLSVFPGQLLDVFIDARIAELQEPGEGKKKHSE